MGAKKYLKFAFLLSGVLSVSAWKSAFDQNLYESALDTEECSRQLDFLTFDPLLLKFIDASASPPSGYGTGNWNDMGDYFQCLSINEVKKEMAFQGKFCMVNFLIDSPIRLPQRPVRPELPELPGLPDIPGIPDFPDLPDFAWPPLDFNTTWPNFPWPPIDNNTTWPNFPWPPIDNITTWPNFPWPPIDNNTTWPNFPWPPIDNSTTWPNFPWLPIDNSTTWPNFPWPPIDNSTTWPNFPWLPIDNSTTWPNFPWPPIDNSTTWPNFPWPPIDNSTTWPNFPWLPIDSNTTWPIFPWPPIDNSTTWPNFPWPPIDNSTTWPNFPWLPIDSNTTWPAFPWPNFPWPGFPMPPRDNNNNILQEADNYRKLKYYVHKMTGVGQPVESRIFPVYIAARTEMSLAMCIPKVCTVKEAISFVEDRLLLVNITYDPYFCRLPNDKPFHASDYTAYAIIAFIGLLLIVSTSYDMYQHFVLKQDPSRVNILYTSFSIYTNTQRFLTFNSSPEALECIDGIRALSMIWVVIGHTYCMSLLGFIHNMGYTLNWLSKVSSVWITSAPIVVDTFFLLSGILSVYATIGKISKARFMRTIHLFYLNRLLRIFPLLAAVVLLQASVLHHVSDGPFWLNVAKAREDCINSWWSALLHVQNYVNPIDICLAHSWYLSVDMQLYIFCPVVLIFLFGRERIAWSALTAALVLSLVASSLYSFLYGFSAALGNFNRIMEFDRYIEVYYFNTLARAPPFMVGMVYGYILHLCRSKKLRISKINVILLWLLSFGMMAFCIFSIHPVMQLDHDIQFFDNFLNAYMRAIWGVGLGWLILACVQGYGGPVNWFLSLQVWKLPARMSYAMYLIHLPIIMIANGSWVKTYYYSDGQNFYRFLGDISLSFIFAFILCITIDAPCSTLQKILNGTAKKRPQKRSPEEIESPTPSTTVETNHYIMKTAL